MNATDSQLENGNKVPTVFVSSVISTLERERELVCKVVESLGWRCDASGIRESRFWGGAQDGCYRRVEASDLYVGIFSARSGSPSFIHEVFITEMEFYSALNARRPMRIYILETPDRRREPSLKHFVDSLKADLYVRTCSSKDLEQVLVRDLEDFNECWIHGDVSTLVPPLYLDEALRHMGIFETEADSYGLEVLGTSKSLDNHNFQASMHGMQRAYEQSQFAEAAEIGANLMLAFLARGLSYDNRDLARRWASFLQMWASSCIWHGYVQGHFGALNSSLMMREAYRMLNDWRHFHEANGLVANSYYVLASRLHVRDSRLGNVRTFVDVTAPQRSALDRALTLDEIRALKYPEPFPHLHRAYVNLELGNYERAIRDFRTMLGYGDVIGERMYFDYLTGLGQALVFKGLTEELQVPIMEGQLLLREAEVGLVKFSNSPFYLSYMKRIAKAFVRLGELQAAHAILDRLLPIAINRKLTHQAEGISALLASIDTQS